MNQYPIISAAPSGKKRAKHAGLLAVCACAVILGMSAGVTTAYLRGSAGELTNVITTGSVEITLTEDAWNPEAARELHPGEAVPKNPCITNTGQNRAWVFLEVTTPVRKLSTAGADGKRLPAKLQELFSFTADEEHWELILEDAGDAQMTRVYGFGRLLQPGETTEALFARITAVSYIEGEISPQESLTIGVRALAVQETEQTESLKELYEMYLQQIAADRKVSRS